MKKQEKNNKKTQPREIGMMDAIFLGLEQAEEARKKNPNLKSFSIKFKIDNLS